MMRLSTEQRSSDWWPGAELTTSASVLRKRKKMIVDFRRVVKRLPAPLCIEGTPVEVSRNIHRP